MLAGDCSQFLVKLFPPFWLHFSSFHFPLAVLLCAPIYAFLFSLIFCTFGVCDCHKFWTFRSYHLFWSYSHSLFSDWLCSFTVSETSFCSPYLCLFFSLDLFYVQMFCLCVCMHIMYILGAGQRWEDGVGFLESGVMYGFEPSCESWELQEQQVLLTDEPYF